MKQATRTITSIQMIFDLTEGDTVGYRLHNTAEVIKDNPARVVSKNNNEVLLDNGIRLKPFNGHWVLKMKDRHGPYFTTFYKIVTEQAVSI